MKKLSQSEKILKALKTQGALTGMDIINMGILNYKGRIHDLRRQGYDISTKMIKVGDAEVAEYRLSKPVSVCGEKPAPVRTNATGQALLFEAERVLPVH
jgi:hypothetical protein